MEIKVEGGREREREGGREGEREREERREREKWYFTEVVTSCAIVTNSCLISDTNDVYVHTCIHVYL